MTLRMKHGLQLIRLMICMFAFTIIFTFCAQSNAYATPYITINGKEYTDASSGPGWIWDGSNELTLNGYKGSAITAYGKLNVTLVNNNEINASKSQSNGISVQAGGGLDMGELSITGKGTLKVRQDNYVGGVWGNRSATISGGATIDALVLSQKTVNIDNAVLKNGVRGKEISINNSTVYGQIGIDRSSKLDDVLEIENSTVYGSIGTSTAIIKNCKIGTKTNKSNILGQELVSIIGSQVYAEQVGVECLYDSSNIVNKNYMPTLSIENSTVESEYGIFVRHSSLLASDNEYANVLSALKQMNKPVITVKGCTVSSDNGNHLITVVGNELITNDMYAMKYAVYGLAYGISNNTISQIKVVQNNTGYRKYEGLAQNVVIKPNSQPTPKPSTQPIQVKASKCSIVLNKTSMVYTGKALKCGVKSVKYAGKTLKLNRDFTVSYKNNKAIGKATITFKFKGNYKGTLSKTFKIVPKTTASVKTKALAKGFKITWKAGSKTQATGYQYRYATSKKTLTKAKVRSINKRTTVSKNITKLKAKKIYYVQVRTYKKVGNVKYYSAWSTAKKVKTK